MTTTTGGPECVYVRQVERADLLSIHRIERATFPQPWPFDAFDRFVDAPAFLVAQDETAEGDGIDEAAVVGYVVADLTPNHGDDIGHVKDIAVAPDRQGEGIGSTLLERALARLAAEGATSVKLEVRSGNDVARSMYEGFGFEAMRRRPGYYDDGEDAIVMVREL